MINFQYCNDTFFINSRSGYGENCYSHFSSIFSFSIIRKVLEYNKPLVHPGVDPLSGGSNLVLVFRDVSVVEGVVVLAQHERVVQRQDVLDAGHDQGVVAGHAAAPGRRRFRFRDLGLLDFGQVVDLDDVVEVAELVLDGRNFRIVAPVAVDGVPGISIVEKLSQMSDPKVFNLE